MLVVVNAANVWGTIRPPLEWVSPCGFQGRDFGNHTNLTIFKTLIWLILDCKSHNYSGNFWLLLFTIHKYSFVG